MQTICELGDLANRPKRNKKKGFLEVSFVQFHWLIASGWRLEWCGSRLGAPMFLSARATPDLGTTPAHFQPKDFQLFGRLG